MHSLEYKDYNINFQYVGKKVLVWAKSDQPFLEKCSQVIHMYGDNAGLVFKFLGEILLKYESPDENIKGILGQCGSFMCSHGEYLKNKAPAWQLMVHAYIMTRLTQETLRYVRKISHIVLKRPDQSAWHTDW